MAAQAEDLRDLWGKYHDNAEAIHELRVTSVLTMQRLESVDKNLQRYVDECSKGHAELKQHVTQLFEAHHRRAGVRDTIRHGLPTLISLSAVLVAVWAAWPTT